LLRRVVKIAKWLLLRLVVTIAKWLLLRRVVTIAKWLLLRRIGPFDLFDAMTSVSMQSRIFRVVIVTILPLVPPGGVLENCFKQKWLPIWQKIPNL